MNEEIKRQIFERIKENDSIVIGRHFRPDGDALGSAKGLERILSLSFPEKRIYVSSSDYSDNLSFLGHDDGEVGDEIIKSSLVIILDTATADRISYRSLLEGKEIIRIDHHIKVEKWNALEWVEDYRSSCSEMIADFYDTFRSVLKIDRVAAEAIYTGMVTDSGNFSYSSTSADTLRMAAIMLEIGVDVERLQAYLNLKDISFYRYREALFSNVKIEKSGLAWVFVDDAFQKKWNLSREDASESVSFMSEIKGSICWLSFISNGDGTIRVRLRSRFMTVDRLASRYHGGGHEKASGATCYSEEEMMALVRDADILTAEYKRKHENWM